MAYDKQGPKKKKKGLGLWGWFRLGIPKEKPGEPAPGSVPSLESFCAVGAARARSRSDQGGGREPAAGSGIPEVSRAERGGGRCPSSSRTPAGRLGQGARDRGLGKAQGGRPPVPSLPGLRGRGWPRARAPAGPQSAWERARGRGGRGAAGARSLARALAHPRTGRPPPRSRPFPSLLSPPPSESRALL